MCIRDSLTVALAYAYDKINSSARDEVFGVWKRGNNRFILKIYLYVDGNQGREEAIKRDRIFRKELPLALAAIAYGDRKFLDDNDDLLNSNIIVRFISAYEEPVSYTHLWLMMQALLRLMH